MANEFFEHPILNSPYEYPSRHWELDDAGQPTQNIIGRRRAARFITLATWLAEELPARFEERILDIDSRVAETWGVVMARAQKIGLTLGSMDAFVAATAEAHSLTLATRNVRDFQRLGISLLDPWHPG
jgi:toxin FitB